MKTTLKTTLAKILLFIIVSVIVIGTLTCFSFIVFFKSTLAAYIAVLLVSCGIVGFYSVPSSFPTHYAEREGLNAKIQNFLKLIENEEKEGFEVTGSPSSYFVEFNGITITVDPNAVTLTAINKVDSFAVTKEIDLCEQTLLDIQPAPKKWQPVTLKTPLNKDNVISNIIQQTGCDKETATEIVNTLNIAGVLRAIMA